MTGVKTDEKLVKVKSRFGQWEIDRRPEPLFGAQMPDGNPFEMVIIVESESYFILNTHVTPKGMEGAAVEAFREAVEKHCMLPHSIAVKDQKLADDLNSIVTEYGIQLERVKRFKAIPEIIRSMKEYFKQ